MEFERSMTPKTYFTGAARPSFTQPPNVQKKI